MVEEGQTEISLLSFDGGRFDLRICWNLGSRLVARSGAGYGQGKPREDVNEKAKQTNQQEEISQASLTRSSSPLVGVLRSSPLRNTSFHGGGLRDRGTGREGVLSLKQRRRNETNQYHPTQQSPHENNWLPGNKNQHGRTSGDEVRLAIYRHCTAKNPKLVS